MRSAYFAPDFLELLERFEPVDVDDSVVHHAAAGMTQLLWRNTAALEDDVHCLGDWDDIAMFRGNTRATAVIRRAVTELIDGSAVTRGEDAGFEMMRKVCNLLPRAQHKDRLWEETSRKAAFWAEALDEFGPQRILVLFVQSPASFVSCPSYWWGHPDYPALVEAVAASLPEKDRGRFTATALAQPWHLHRTKIQRLIDQKFI